MSLYGSLAFVAAVCVAFFVGVLVGSRSKQAKIRKLERKLKQMEAKTRGGREPRPVEGKPQGEGGVQLPASGKSDSIPAGETGKPVPGGGQPESVTVKTNDSPMAGTMTRDQWYQKFGQTGTLAMHFNYSFPEKMYFQPGTGYIRNARNQIIPDKKVFSTVNTATGYAMEGLFWAFDVIYQGREYTFRQIMDGQMTTGYVRVEGIPSLAVAEPAGVNGCYRLTQKGKLKIVDV